MPAWSTSGGAASSGAPPYIGVKLVTSFPDNSARGLPGVHAAYLTVLRTAAISALAAKFLARENSQVLLMVGSGGLAPYLVRAHLLVRPRIRRCVVWNRRAERSRRLVEALRGEAALRGVEFTVAEELNQEVLGVADVVSCATSSPEPLGEGVCGQFGGAGGGRGAGGSFQERVMAAGDVAGTLTELVSGGVEGRRSEEELTVFKSVARRWWTSWRLSWPMRPTWGGALDFCGSFFL
ncbi:unnamed protein product [Spirodela intermedia]|uniref:Uncharacterized protein n=1 Tax=Spirodela intermedia TaxID=51605 RepID=A0A7I8JI30_SPIIN|nr:unnamed protein product [Spirodela intermedia]CAA6669819.1 unnamed protein product [Spirodela intermedia]